MEEESVSLHAAIIEQDEDAARSCILAEADVDALSPDGWAPLHLSAQTNNQKITKWLVNAGAQVNIKNEKGVTPLHSCSWSNAFQVAELLIQHGSNVNVTDNLDWTPLMLAAWSNHDDLVDLYIGQGASINSCNHNGSSALHLAVYNNCLLAVERLLEHKADVNIQNNDRMTAIDIAIKRGNSECEEMLRKYSSKPQSSPETITTRVSVDAKHYTDSKVGPAKTAKVQSAAKKPKKAAAVKPPSAAAGAKNKPEAASSQQSDHSRNAFVHFDSPEQDMPFITELTKEQTKLSSDGNQSPPIFPEQLIHITLAGDRVRRRSEVVIANLLYSLDLNYVYERKLCGTVSVGINYPAFTVFCPDDSIIIWEHISALATPEKKQQFSSLKRWYSHNGFVEEKSFFVSRDTDQGGINSQEIWDVAEKINTLVQQATLPEGTE